MRQMHHEEIMRMQLMVEAEQGHEEEVRIVASCRRFVRRD